MSSVRGILAHAMEHHGADVLGEHLARVIKNEGPGAGPDPGRRPPD